LKDRTYLIIKRTTLSLLFIIALRCSDSFLDTKPFGSTTIQALSETRSGAESLLIGAYSMLDGIPFCNDCDLNMLDVQKAAGASTSNWIYGSVAGGDAYKGSLEDDISEITTIELHNATPLNFLATAKWQACYIGIQRANDAIRAFRNLSDISESERQMRLAEGTFLRAYFHYDLYRIFRFVPYIDETIEDTRISNQDDILPRIESDLKFANEHLPLVQTEPGRITKGAAQSYLGIAYMWQKDFATAKVYFDSIIITSGQYKLLYEYHNNFNADFKNNEESILAVQQSVNDGAMGLNGNMGDIVTFPNVVAGCCSFHQPSQNLVNAFKTDANGLPLLDTYNDSDVTNDDGLSSDDTFTPYTGSLDPRLDWTVGRRGIPYLDWGTHKGASWIRDQRFGGPYSPIKNVYHKSQQEQVSDAGYWISLPNSNNLKLLRYSDVLLYAAEAEVELNNLTRAQELVNMVRERAMHPEGFVMDGAVPAANYVIGKYNTPWTDKAYARKAVRFERRLELGMEGHRFFDLVRWGIAAEEKNKYFEKESLKRYYMVGAFFEQGKDELMPIPDLAIQLSVKGGGPTLIQNEGY